MKIAGLLQLEDIIPNLAAVTKEQVLHELAAKAVERHPDIDQDKLFRILLERERLGSTGIGDGVGIPHGKLKRLGQPVLLFGRSLEGVSFNSLDGRKVNLFFTLVAPEGAEGVHLKMLARISRIMKDPVVRRALLDARDANTMYEIIQEQDNRY